MHAARPFVLGSFLLVLLSAACSSTVETTGTGGGGTGGVPATGGNGGTGGIPICPQEAFPCCQDVPDDPCCADCQPTTMICGGELGAPCPPDEYCDFGDNQCGGNDGTGICTKRPVGCPDNAQPVCGCDGQIHGNECDAQASGSDISILGGCKPPPGKFGCGAQFCALGTEYCERFNSDIGGEPPTFTCQPIPAFCAGPDASCSCLTEVPCGSNCSTTGDGGLQVICLGG
ncbi:MAG: hypothetical protein QM820_31055 [Minicystis sp.]